MELVVNESEMEMPIIFTAGNLISVGACVMHQK